MTSSSCGARCAFRISGPRKSRPQKSRDRKSTRLNSSHGYISYAVFCLKKKITTDAQQQMDEPTGAVLPHTQPYDQWLYLQARPSRTHQTQLKPVASSAVPVVCDAPHLH